MSRFFNERKDNWQRLEDLLTLVRGDSLRGLSKMEVREFGELLPARRVEFGDCAVGNARSEIDKLFE